MRYLRTSLSATGVSLVALAGWIGRANVPRGSRTHRAAAPLQRRTVRPLGSECRSHVRVLCWAVLLTAGGGHTGSWPVVAQVPQPGGGGRHAGPLCTQPWGRASAQRPAFSQLGQVALRPRAPARAAW
eukprot:scaffold2554_cov321-Prasinococcus_capsulatus_cf.AAC.3